MNEHQISKQTQTMIEFQILKDNRVSKQTQIMNEPQILKYAQIFNEN